MPRFFKEIGTNVDVTEFSVVGLASNDTDVVATIHWTFTVHTTGKSASMYMQHWFRFAGGKIVFFRVRRTPHSQRRPSREHVHHEARRLRKRPRVALKDLVDVVGVPTTAGSGRSSAARSPRRADAACLAGVRAADARVVGKTNLHELAMLPIGTNPWFGTPVNPLDPELIPGGSSSGSAVAVATTRRTSDRLGHRRVDPHPIGVLRNRPASRRHTVASRSTVCGPSRPASTPSGRWRRTVSGLALGMKLLEPGFRPAADAARVVGRVRTNAHPDIEAAVDAALQAAELEVVTLDWDILEPGSQAFAAIYFAEMWDADHALVDANPDDVGPDIAQTVATAEVFPSGADEARHALVAWKRQLFELFDRVEVLALPTLPMFPAATRRDHARLVAPDDHRDHQARRRLQRRGSTVAPRSPCRRVAVTCPRACSSSRRSEARSSS